MRTRVVLSVDTEPSVAGAITWPGRFQPLIDEPVLGEVNGRSEGLGFILEVLARRGLTATFFVETAHVRAFGEAPMRRYVETIMAAGHDVQLHLHPVWRSWRNGSYCPSRRSTDACADVPEAELVELFAQGREMLERWTGKPVIAARAGNFSASRQVLAASARAGLPLTSHINIAMAPPREPELRRRGGALRHGGAREFPVTCFTDPIGSQRGVRSLQVGGIASGEMQATLDALRAREQAIAMVVMHPFDFLKRRNSQFEGMRADGLAQQRLEALAAHLAGNPDRFEVVTFPAAAAALPEDPPEPRIDGQWFRALPRMATNYLNHRWL